MSATAATGRLAGLALLLLVLLPPVAAARSGRERAQQQIPALMGRILDSHEELVAQERRVAPELARHEQTLSEAKRAIERAATQEQASEALLDYLEAYQARIEIQGRALRAMRQPITRMRADARELGEASRRAGRGRRDPAERRAFFGGHFQGLASGLQVLAERLDRPEEAGTAGSVLQASWASYGRLELPLAAVGPEGAASFAAKIEGLYARHRARERQLIAERRSVRRLLDVMVSGQLSTRLDVLFAGRAGSLLSPDGKSHDWEDLSHVVERTLRLPAPDAARVADAPARERLDWFARGGHRE